MVLAISSLCEMQFWQSAKQENSIFFLTTGTCSDTEKYGRVFNCSLWTLYKHIALVRIDLRSYF